jgi:hypothetical protein
MTLGGYWPPSSKVKIADFWGGRIVHRDVFFASIFFSVRGTKTFFRFRAGKFSSAALIVFFTMYLCSSYNMAARQCRQQ